MSARGFRIGAFSGAPNAQQAIDEFQSDSTAIDREPYPFLARATLHVFTLMVIAAVTWAALAKLDRVVSARGKILSLEATIQVQPIETSIIKSIEVKVGDVVKAGQALAALDPTFAQADMEQLRTRLAGLKAQIARLQAERENHPFVVPAEIPAEERNYWQLQMSLWQERVAQLKSQSENYDEKLARVKANIATRDQDIVLLQTRLEILKEVEAMRMKLESNQVGSRLNSLQARDARIEIQRSLTLTERDRIERGHELQALEAERETFFQQWQTRVVEDLVARQTEYDGVSEQLIKASKRNALVRLEAPVDAVVLELGQKSAGSVVNGAESIMTLVPMNAGLEVEATIDARTLAHIEVGDRVTLKLDAYPYQEYGFLEGRVRTISEDAFTNRQDINATPYYRARIELTSRTLEKEPENFRLLPGMPLTAEIKIGDRSVLTYIMGPILRGMDESMREP